MPGKTNLWLLETIIRTVSFDGIQLPDFESTPKCTGSIRYHFMFTYSVVLDNMCKESDVDGFTPWFPLLKRDCIIVVVTSKKEGLWAVKSKFS